MIRNAIHAASDDALRYAAQDLGYARKGHAGNKGAEAGEIGWVTFAHDAARPTVELQDGSDGATHLLDAPIAGDPHYHLHNFIPNLVVTDDGRVGSIELEGADHPQGPRIRSLLSGSPRRPPALAGLKDRPRRRRRGGRRPRYPRERCSDVLQARPAGGRRREALRPRTRDGLGRALARAQETDPA